MKKILLIIPLLLCPLAFFAQTIIIEELKIDRQVTPLGFDNLTPEFSWELISEHRNIQQSAWEIIVADDLHHLENGRANCWKSGKQTGSKTFGIPYAGVQFKPFTRYFWKVRVWDQQGNISDWSKASWFETAMLKDSDWKAEWITDDKPLPVADEDFYKDLPNPLLRKTFTAKKEIRSARLYMIGLGYPVAFLNGERIGDHMLDTPWTQFNKELLYTTFDISNLIRKGENAIGIMLGNGWYNPMPLKMFQRWNLRDALTVGKPAVKAQLRITYNDGSVETIATNNGWQAGHGPVLMNSVYLGEKYDARLEQKGWCEPHFDAKHWVNATIIDGPRGKLIANYIPPVRVTRILKPVKMSEPKPGCFIFDFGQNFAGVPTLRVKGPAGTTVTLRGGEDLHADGSLNYLTVIAGQLKAMWNLRGGPGCPDDPMMVISYTLKGEGEEIFIPQFTFSSFRYIEVTGFPGKPNLSTVEGLRMNSDIHETGSFSCSNDMFNRIQQMAKWTFLSNLFSVQSDCPAREKFGYGADIVTTAEAFSYNFDMSKFYRKTVRDFANDVRPNGGMTEIAPNIGINQEGFGGETGSTGWQLAYPFAIKLLHDYYGDNKTAEEQYENLKRQVDFMHHSTPDHIVKSCISDHESIDPKPVTFSATAFYYHHILILCEIASYLNKQNDRITYEMLASEVKEAMVKQFLKPGSGQFDSGTQAAQLIAFWYDLVPETEKTAAFDNLLLEIFNKHKGHLSTGIFATKFMFDFFREKNRNDVTYSIANQRDFPGWGNMLSNGATTLYESWQYPDTVASQNHPMFGSISEWFYKSLLGINTVAPGFSKIEIKPQPAGDLSWAKGSYHSMSGLIAVDWKIEGVKFKMKVSVPANVTATIYLPALPNSKIMESKKEINQENGLKLSGFRDGYAILDTGSGNYDFESIYQP